MARRLSKSHERPVRRPPRHASADDRRAAHPGRAGRHRAASSATVDDARRRLLRRAVQPARRRAARCPTGRTAIAAVHGRRRHRRRRDRPARLRADDAARPRSAPTSPSARRSASACRWASAARTPAFIAAGESAARALPGPPRRRQHRHRRPAGAAPRAADPRAAHPPREGDVEHLHRAGAAGQHGRPLRQLARSRRAAPDRRAGAPADRRSPRARSRAAGSRAASTTRGSTRCRSTVADAAAMHDAARDAGLRPAPRRRRTVGMSLRRDERACRPSSDVLRAVRRRRCRPARRRRRRRAARCAATGEILDAGGVPPLPHRARDAALPAPPRRQGPRPRPHDDPARARAR